MRRLTPLVGRRPWFGPRRLGGWGWSPVTWEGWVTSTAWTAVVLASSWLPEGWPQALGVVGGVLGLLVAVLLKGTSPGDRDDAVLLRMAQRSPEEREADRQRRRRTEDEPSLAGTADRLRRFRRPGAS